jgi:hypothetical protein
MYTFKHSNGQAGRLLVEPKSLQLISRNVRFTNPDNRPSQKDGCFLIHLVILIFKLKRP